MRASTGRHRSYTLVVPVLNEAQTIVACLRSVLEQSILPDEILVVDGGSEDGTPDLVAETIGDLVPFRILQNPERRVPQALNIAALQTRTEVLIRLDGHATINKEYCAVLLEALESGQYAGAGGRKRAVGDALVPRSIARALNSRLGVGGSKYHYVAEPEEVDHVPFGAYAVDAIREIGGWNESLPVNQDYEFDFRLRQSGRKIWLDPRAVIDWRARKSIPGLFRQYRRYGAGKIAVLRLHPQSIKLRQVLPAALVVGLGVTAIMGPVVGPLPFACAVVGYVGSVTVGGLWITAVDRNRKDLYAIAGPLTVLSVGAMHLGYGLGLIAGWRGRSYGSQTGGADSSAGTEIAETRPVGVVEE